MPLPTDTPNTYPNYTNLGLNEGVFDRLMIAAKAHIAEEFKAGRINAADYGQVFLGVTEGAMQYATQYLLGMLLIEEKRRAQDLANQKLEYELEELLPLDADLKRAQINKINAEISLMTKQEELIDNQILKLIKEIAFLDAKIQTELANTDETIPDAGSLIGKQLSLLTAQRLGFAGDIYAKVGKLWADYDAVFQSVQEIETGTNLSAPTQTELTNAKNIASAINALS